MARPLTILSVAYALAPVGPDSVGGAEQVLAALDRALVAAGHRSIVVAQEGSRLAGELVPIPAPDGPLDEDAKRAAQATMRRAVAAMADCADLVHMHGIDFAETLPPPGRPTLVTLHLPPAWYADLAPSRPRTFLHCVSAHQHAACPPSPFLLSAIPNGVDTAAFASGGAERRDYALMLGRICPEKGQHLALEAAHLADAELLIAGMAYDYPEHQAYLDEQVLPLLDARRRLVGPVGFTAKGDLLGRARCVLIPSLAPETSSLVAMEALACGAPVIAFPNGALPEIVEDGATGFLVEDAAAMAAAIGRAREIDAETCRAAARERFDSGRMLEAYLRRYHDLVTAHALTPALSRLRAGEGANTAAGASLPLARAWAGEGEARRGATGG